MLRKYWLIAKNTYAEYATYRLNFILWRVRMVIRFLITYFLWSTIFASGHMLFGYQRSQMLTYVVLIYIVSNFVFATKTHDLGGEINEGKLTNYLLKPFSYFAFLLARDVSDKALNIFCTLVEINVLFWVLKPPFFIQTNAWLLGLFLWSLIGGIMIFFFISLLLGFIGFWTPEVWAPRFVFFMVVSFLAGDYFPIDILPRPVVDLLTVTPFPYLYYFPVKIYLGQLSTFEVLKGLLILTIWAGLFFWLVNQIWQKGLKKYSAQGR